MTAISADQLVDECLVRVQRTLVAEFGHTLPGRIIDGVVHEARDRVLTGAASTDEEQLLLQTCRISLQARVDLGHG